MRYHNITHDDMLNGEGLRVVLWVSGCTHHCEECHNPITWDINGGLEFGSRDKEELWHYLGKDYTAGITFSGGDPFHPQNREEVAELIRESKARFPEKTVWIYTGFLWEEVKDLSGIEFVDVLVDGEFQKELHHGNIRWCGSTNQRVIDVQKTLTAGSIVLWTKTE